jgi:hypothetical protein
MHPLCEPREKRKKNADHASKTNPRRTTRIHVLKAEFTLLRNNGLLAENGCIKAALLDLLVGNPSLINRKD